jgi:hypothetical protein
MEIDILKELCYAPILSRSDKINRLKTIGRKIPFGKYKGDSVLYLLVKHWKYMQWILDNTNFKLNETEEWFNNYLDEQESLQHTDKILYGLSQVASKCDVIDSFPETNPHYIIE